jgi:GAF domain-containing protein/anti-sigma regulatory factor (Ser/Thr protein kinase)
MPDVDARPAPGPAGDGGARGREWVLPAQPISIGELRRGVSEFVRGQGAEEEVVGTIALALTEAATNAVVHGFVGREPGKVRVIAEPADEEIVVRVLDDGRGMQPRPDSPGLGMGLPLMGQLTSTLDIRRGAGGGTEVRMAFAAPGVRAPVPGPREGALAEERRRLLEEVGRLGSAGGWPGEDVDRLVALLVPGLADTAALSVVQADGSLRRFAGRVAGPDSAARSAWLAAQDPQVDRPGSSITEALHTGRTQMMELDAIAIREVMPHERGEELVASLGLRWWISVPLSEGERMWGVLGLGISERRGRPDEELLAFLQVLGDRAARSLANARLIDELRRTRRRLERILAALAEAVTVTDGDGRVVYANPAAARLLGAADVQEVLDATPGELAGRFIIEREDGTPVGPDEFPGNRLIAGAPAEPLLTRSVERASGRERWLLTKATLLDDDARLAVNIIEDVTEAKTAELRQRFLAEAGTLLASALDYEQTLERLAGLVVPQLADWCAIDLLDARGSLQRVALAHADPAKVELGRELHAAYPPDLAADPGLRPVLREGRPQLFPDVTDEMLVAGAVDERHLGVLRAVGMRSAMLVPMPVHDRTIGVLTLVNAESRRAFDADDLTFAQDLARRAALAIESARLLPRG